MMVPKTLEDIINVPVDIRGQVVAPLICKDGFEISIQASRSHYCHPRTDTGPWDHVELGYPSIKPTEDILKYAEDSNQPLDSIYGYVPVRLVKELLAIHNEKEPLSKMQLLFGDIEL